MLSFADTIRAVESIENTIDSAGYGWPNTEALKSVEVQLFILKTGRADAYITEKLGIISLYAEALYRSRKADALGGSEQVRGVLRAACQGIKDRARFVDQPDDY